MTLSTANNFIDFVGTGASNQVFSIPFQFIQNSDINVVERVTATGVGTLQTLGVHYNISGAGNPAGGSITWIGTSPAATSRIEIWRWVLATQATVFPLTGALNTANLEEGLDKLTMAVSQLMEQLGGTGFSLNRRSFIGRTADGAAWDALSDQIQALADPTAAQHAATRAWVNAQLAASTGGFPVPDIPGDNDRVLQSRAGVVDYHDVAVPDPAAGEANFLLEATAAGEGNFAFRLAPTYYNALINGDFRISQRGTVFTATSVPLNNNDTYLLDRWILQSDDTVTQDIVDVTQDNTVSEVGGPGGAYSAILFDFESTASPSEKFGILQILEARDAARLWADGGGVASLSFRARTESLEVENLRAAILAWNSTEDVPTSDLVSAWNAEGTNPTLIANWTIEANAAGDPPANLGLTNVYQRFTIENIVLNTALTTNLAVFIWVDDTDLVANDRLWITDVQLDPGAHARPFVRRHVAQEQADCERYFQTSYEPSEFGGAGVLGQEQWRAGANYTSSDTEMRGFRFHKAMRAIPTVETYSPSDGEASHVRDLAAASNFLISKQDIGRHGFRINTAEAPGPGHVAGGGDAITMHWSADAEL